MQAPDDDLALLVAAALRAGEIAKQFFGQDPKVYDKGAEGPVTEADIAIDAMLHDTLCTARPDYGWLSEETEDTDNRLSHDRVFICDPIDGTRAFIKGERSFSHSLAVARNGVVSAAAVFLPMRDKMYAAAAGQGATLNKGPLRVSPARQLENSTILTTKPNLQAKHWPGGVPTFGKAYRPSLAYRMSLVGEGRFDAMLTFRPTWEWDIAAGTLIIQEAGGVVTDGLGHDLRFNSALAQQAGVIAGAPGIHGDLMRLRNLD